MTSPSFGSRHIGDDACIDLVQGLLEPESRNAVLQHLESCASCEARFQEMAASHARAESLARDILGQPAVAPATASSMRGGGRRRRTIWLLAASLVPLAVALATFTRLQSPPRLPSGESLLRLPAAKLRGAVRELGILGADSLMTAGLDAYNRGDFASARPLLETARANGRLEDVRRIYLGSTLLQLGDAEKATAMLRAVDPAVVPEPWRSESRWELAVALARTGRTARADSLLAVLAREHGPVADRARAQRLPASRLK